MADKCLIRLENLLRGSSVRGNLKDEILSTIKKVQAEKKISKLDDINVDAIAKDVKEQIKLQKEEKKQSVPNGSKKNKSRVSVKLMGSWLGNNINII